MIYNHKEIKEKYKSDYQINKAIENKVIYKIEKNIYSDTKNINYLEMLSKKYTNAIFTMDSAFYFHNLTDVIPSKINLATKRNALRIKDDKSLLKKWGENARKLSVEVYDKDILSAKVVDVLEKYAEA